MNWQYCNGTAHTIHMFSDIWKREIFTVWLFVWLKWSHTNIHNVYALLSRCEWREMSLLPILCPSVNKFFSELTFNSNRRSRKDTRSLYENVCESLQLIFAYSIFNGFRNSRCVCVVSRVWRCEVKVSTSKMKRENKWKMSNIIHSHALCQAVRFARSRRRNKKSKKRYSQFCVAPTPNIQHTSNTSNLISTYRISLHFIVANCKVSTYFRFAELLRAQDKSIWRYCFRSVSLKREKWIGNSRRRRLFFFF